MEPIVWFIKLFQEYSPFVVWWGLAAWILVDSKLQSNKFIKLFEDKLDEIRLAIWRRTYTPEETIQVVREKVWYASLSKLDFIRDVLINNHINERKEEVRDNIRTKLEELSQMYIEEFNTFNTPIVKLWDVVAENFEFDKFFEDIMKIVFREGKDSTAIELKIKDIESIMRKYQNRVTQKLTSIMSKKCINCFQNVK